MLDQFSNIISWPNKSQIDEIFYGFESISSFNSSLKKVIRAVDGFHICILPTIKNFERYINRKPGSVYDARVFQRSSLFHEIQTNKQRFFPNNTYIIRDSAFMLRSWLMTLIKQYNNRIQEERNYNKIYSSTHTLNDIVTNLGGDDNYFNAYELNDRQIENLRKQRRLEIIQELR
ncbi:9236_t:CDS:2 [Funneliformis geosporum]|uniref:1582_t:CDS:1 n=1 Tax=Funneliformis geosporum TaxID=1117311 RepID=A0A9W4T195_9GLOM|nr:1582_t:CDS:2 [Funneliformis geosporum]CAI2189536.1 9236_t:CDS:2 [Funneliformis geosporum]